MRKLSFTVVIISAIVSAASSSFSIQGDQTYYYVYGIDFGGYFSHEYEENPALWSTYLNDLWEQTEASENPITTEPLPSNDRQALEDFASSCDDDLIQVCMILVKCTDGVKTVEEVLPGEFIGF